MLWEGFNFVDVLSGGRADKARLHEDLNLDDQVVRDSLICYKGDIMFPPPPPPPKPQTPGDSKNVAFNESPQDSQGASRTILSNMRKLYY